MRAVELYAGLNSDDRGDVPVESVEQATLRIKSVPARRPLSTTEQKKFKRLVTVLADEIVQSWVNYFVYHRPIVTKTIGVKL